MTNHREYDEAFLSQVGKLMHQLWDDKTTYRAFAFAAQHIQDKAADAGIKEVAEAELLTVLHAMQALLQIHTYPSF